MERIVEYSENLSTDTDSYARIDEEASQRNELENFNTLILPISTSNTFQYDPELEALHEKVIILRKELSSVVCQSEYSEAVRANAELHASLMKVQLMRQFKWHISLLLTISAALHDQENTNLLQDSRVNNSGEGVNPLTDSSFQAGRIQNDIEKLAHEIIAALRDKNVQLKNLSIEKTILQNLYNELLQRHECLKKQHEGTLTVIEAQKERLSALDSLNKDLTEGNRNVCTKLLITENLLNRLKVQNYSISQEIKTSIENYMSTILTRHMDQIRLNFFQTNQRIDAQLHRLFALKQYLNENKSKLKIGLYNNTNGRKHTFCQTDPELIQPTSMNPKRNQFTQKHHHHHHQMCTWPFSKKKLRAVEDQKSIMHKLHSIIKMLKQINSMNTNSIDKDNSMHKSIDKAFNIQQNIDTLEQTEQLLNMINSHSNRFMSTGNKSIIYDNQKVLPSSSLNKCIGKKFYNLKVSKKYCSIVLL
uniref:Uncharacterized protein n=1 Tax=Trichobilharzia regenti TaxID=157069 RepID=A0AA85JFK0_TRIRE|nr:unnamed protein product [Trichobilharzia regenti]